VQQLDGNSSITVCSLDPSSHRFWCMPKSPMDLTAGFLKKNREPGWIGFIGHSTPHTGAMPVGKLVR